jgi:nucleotide-binding universal stress UspA family protein
MQTYKKILVPLDGTKLSARVLDVALQIAQPGKGRVVLLHVEKEPASLLPGECEAGIDEMERDTARLLSVAKKRLADGERVVAEVRRGPIAHVILTASEEHQADLVVMGCHGRRGLQDQIVGNTSERVLAKATCSVLVVRPPGYPYLRD